MSLVNVPVMRRQLGFRISQLFSAGEQGVWYDPSDFSTMFQDAAGTTPVTAVEQAVGRILDKSGNGNHATQTTDTKRPVLSARYNLLTNTEEFEAASWSRFQSIISNNYVTGPFGRPADLLVANTDSGEHVTWQTINFVSGLRYRFSIYLKNHTTTYGRYQVNDNSAFGFNASVTINLNNNTITGDSGALNRALTSLGNGWFKAEFEAVATSTTTTAFNIRLLNSAGGAIYSGDGASGVYLGAVDLRVANDGSGQPVYQRVNTATDYDTAGFKPYLRFDGIDDALQTASVNFTGTDKVTVWAGVRKLSNSALNMIVELSTSVGTTNPGSFYFASLTSGRYEVATSGTANVFLPTANNSFVAPITNVITSLFVISTDTCNLRANGALITSSSSDQGTGNYGNYPLYIGSRGGTTFRFNGRLYSLIIRGAQSTATEIRNAETYVNSRTGAY